MQCLLFYIDISSDSLQFNLITFQKYSYTSHEYHIKQAVFIYLKMINIKIIGNESFMLLLFN